MRALVRLDGERVVRLAFPRPAGERDLAGAGEFLDAVGAEKVLHRLDLVGGAGRLDRERVAPDIDDLGAEDVGDLDDLVALLGGRVDLEEHELPVDRLAGSRSWILITLMSLCSCLVICSSGVSSALTTSVMRESFSSSVGPTASESMLKPRRANSEVTRVSTPGLFSTSTDSVWLIYSHTSSSKSSSSISDTGHPGTPPSISSIEPPGATIGNTHSSRDTRTSTSAGPS